MVSERLRLALPHLAGGLKVVTPARLVSHARRLARPVGLLPKLVEAVGEAWIEGQARHAAECRQEVLPGIEACTLLPPQPASTALVIRPMLKAAIVTHRLHVGMCTDQRRQALGVGLPIADEVSTGHAGGALDGASVDARRLQIRHELRRRAIAANLIVELRLPLNVEALEGLGREGRSNATVMLPMAMLGHLVLPIRSTQKQKDDQRRARAKKKWHDVHVFVVGGALHVMV